MCFSRAVLCREGHLTECAIRSPNLLSVSRVLLERQPTLSWRDGDESFHFVQHPQSPGPGFELCVNLTIGEVELQ